MMVLIQLADFYIRYLPLKSRTSPEEKRRLWLRLFIWAIFTIAIYEEIFLTFGVKALIYKAIMGFGWLPFFVITVLTVRRQLSYQFFILGMSGLWTLSQHNLAEMIDAIFFSNATAENIFLIHSALYLGFFVVLLPIIKYFFEGMTDAETIFQDRLQGKYLALLPALLGIGHFLLWQDEYLWHSWSERISRLYLIFGFFCIYQYILIGTKNFNEAQKVLREQQLLEEQLEYLEQHNQLIAENQEQMQTLKKNLREDYEQLISLLKKSDKQGVLNFLKQREDFLESTKIIRFCRAPLINAAISIYMQQSKKFGIKFEHKIKMPAEISTDESDFAILLSNLLENAFIASKKQPPNERKISILIKYNARQCILEVSNLYNEPLRLSQNGFPISTKKKMGGGAAVHGIGMLSVSTFAKKYNAQVAFEQLNGKVRFVMYWEEAAK
ncbi:MAG: GHKL domain-containing protein [Selenomonadaceae bacterium]|nr:GHKL domain-containing protein [Selenomonadaceae bacterium]